MIVELGHYALVLATVLALVQTVLPWLGTQHSRPYAYLTGPVAVVQFVLIAGSFAALTYAYVTSDFSVANVASNSHSLKPDLYKWTGVWGNHEGSMLLWILILSLYAALVAIFGTNLSTTFKGMVLSVQGAVGLLFLAFTVATSNPFWRLDPAPVDGRGLNPILQDPGLAFHPPFLYAGYVGLSLTFAFAVAALIEGKVDAVWARWVRPWTLVAWAALTVGIALGSYWAYYELGWGGWWFWDPVENASLMPWLAATALLHSAIVTEKREAFKSWTVLLAIVAFGMSLIGTFLVRSGVLTSVHAFANDPERGVFILLIIVVLIGGAFWLYAARAPHLRVNSAFSTISRESALMVNNLLLAVITLTVFFGTLYPLFLDVLGGGSISVGPPYFNITFGPLAALLLLVVPLGTMLPWKRGALESAVQQLRFAGAVSLLVLVLSVVGTQHVLASIGLALAAWLVLGAVTDIGRRARFFSGSLADSMRRLTHLPRSAYGSAIAHAGLGVLVVGVTAMGAWRMESIHVLQPGEQVEFAGYTVKLENIQQTTGPNYISTRSTFSAERQGQSTIRVFPEKRLYPVQGQATTEAGIHTTLVGDLYVVLGDPQTEQAAGGWAVKLYFNPMVIYIWIGPIIMALGGLVSLSDRRLRIGVPAARRRPVRDLAAAE